MDLSNNVVKRFVEVLKPAEEKSDGTTVYGTIVDQNGDFYVRIDGSEQLTPVSSTVALEPGSRVIVLLKNHTATVIGSTSDPSVNEKTMNAALEVRDNSIIATVKSEIDDVSSTFEQTANGFEFRLTGVEEDVSDASNTAAIASANAAEAISAADDAAKTATNYITGNSSGLVVGYQADGTLGRNVQLTSTDVNIRNGSTTLASFGASKISLGANSTSSVIGLCGDSATITSRTDSSGGAGIRLEGGTSNAPYVAVTANGAFLAGSNAENYYYSAVECWVNGVGMRIYAEPDLQIQADDVSIVCGNSGGVTVNGYLSSLEHVAASTTVRAGTWVRAGTHLYFGYDSIESGSYTTSGSRGILTPYSDGAYHYIVERNSAGTTSAFGYASAATVIRGTSIKNGSGTSITSDERLKKDFAELDKWEAFYDNIEPCAFKYKAGTSGRYHIGFKAQQIEQSLLDAGLTTQDFGGFVTIPYEIDPDNPIDTAAHEDAEIADGDDEHNLIYTEFIALNTYKIKKLEAENKELKERLAAIESLLGL